jgi:hypothetical protein
MLNAHSRIYCGPEANFLRDFHGDYLHDPIRHGRFMHAVRAWLPEDEVLEVLGAAFIDLHQRACRAADKERWADKDPANVIYLSDWARLLGREWFFVHVVRNPLDTLASIKQVEFPYTIPADLDGRIAFYLRYTQAGLDFAASHPDRYHRVTYEDLVTDPRSTLTSLMASVGDAFEPVQLTFNAANQQTGLEDPKVTETRGVHRDRVGGWRAWLSEEEARQVIEACRSTWLAVDPEGRWLEPGPLDAVTEHVRTADAVKEEMRNRVPDGATVLVISKGDDDLLATLGPGARHFPQDEGGGYLGYYPDGSIEALQHLESARAEGETYLLVPRTAFWWLDHYREFARYLEDQHHAIWRGDACVIYRLTEKPLSSPSAMDAARPRT